MVLTSGQKGLHGFSQAGLLVERRLKKGNFCARSKITLKNVSVRLLAGSLLSE